MKQIGLMLTIAVAIILCGCGGSNPMVGTWKLQMDESALKEMPAGMKAPEMTLEFKGDGTVTGSFVMGEMKSTMSGTYSLEGKKLTMKVTHEDGKPSDGGKEDVITLSDDMKSFELPGAGPQGKMVKQ